MNRKDNQQGHFAPDYKPVKARAVEELALPKNRQESWATYYKNYLLKRPMVFLIVIGLALEVQPYEPIQPTYFIATRIVNREEIILSGVEDETAHKEGVVSKLQAQIEQAKQCQMQRDIAANMARNECVRSGKSSGYCRFVYEQAKALDCPEMPKLNSGE
ncbi:MAG: hypothetical protein KZQ89_02915 [Candidatus Thiodiazotropha sp. (ex Lucinoma kastoroae)]|nr:hypothetical protein [Candidatus Thiodiazotropha sp. (ex Lucinoma kastoroae)]